MSSIPCDWRSRLKQLPDRCGLTKVTEALGCEYQNIGSLRTKNKEFDDAIFRLLATPRPQHIYKGDGYSPETYRQSSRDEIQEPRFPRLDIHPDDLLVCLNRTILRLNHYPSQMAEQHLTRKEKKYIAALVGMAGESIKSLRKERRHLLTELNQAKTRIHMLKRVGSITIHASGND